MSLRGCKLVAYEKRGKEPTEARSETHKDTTKSRDRRLGDKEADHPRQPGGPLARPQRVHTHETLTTLTLTLTLTLIVRVLSIGLGRFFITFRRLKPSPRINAQRK